MRIAFVCPGLHHGGAETQLIALATQLHALGHTVRVNTLFRGTARVAALREAGVEVFEYDKRLRLDLRLLARMRRDLRAFAPDVLQGMLFDGNLYARLAGAGLGVPVVCAERSSDYELRRSQRLAQRLTHRLTDAVIANSYAGAALARRMFPTLAADRVHVVWNGIDAAAAAQRAAGACGLRAALGVATSARLLCFVGAVKPEKDVPLALRTAALLFQREGPPWHLVMLGAAYAKVGEYRIVEFEQSQTCETEVAQMIANFPSGRIHRLGVSDQVIETIAQCDVLLSTSRREGFPNVVLEAMVAGTPVVSTAYSDIERILPRPWQVVGSRDPAALADAVERAYAEAPVLAAAQRAWVQANAGLERLAKATLQVYRACQEGGR